MVAISSVNMLTSLIRYGSRPSGALKQSAWWGRRWGSPARALARVVNSNRDPN